MSGTVITFYDQAQTSFKKKQESEIHIATPPRVAQLKLPGSIQAYYVAQLSVDIVILGKYKHYQ